LRCFSRFFVFFSSRRRHTRSKRDWSSDVCSSDLGGFGCGSQITAALGMGASGVVIGTKFLTAHEIWAHDDYKKRLIEAQPTDTRSEERRVGKEGRSRWTRDQYIAKETVVE